MMANRPPDCRLRDSAQKLSVEDIDALDGQMLEERSLIGECCGYSFLSLAMIARSTWWALAAVGSVVRMQGKSPSGSPPAARYGIREAIPTLVIGAYRMGFEINPSGRLRGCACTSTITIWARTGKLFGPLFGPIYARWCVDRMASDAARRFRRPADAV